MTDACPGGFDARFKGRRRRGRFAGARLPRVPRLAWDGGGRIVRKKSGMNWQWSPSMSERILQEPGAPGGVTGRVRTGIRSGTRPEEGTRESLSSGSCSLVPFSPSFLRWGWFQVGKPLTRRRCTWAQQQPHTPRGRSHRDDMPSGARSGSRRGLASHGFQIAQGIVSRVFASPSGFLPPPATLSESAK